LDLVRTLVALVDKRDPYAAHHSTRVAMVAQAIAREMGLGEQAIQTVGFAGSLMNLGKILVPTELLTKTGQLNEEEIGRIRDSLRATADFLEGIDFGGPVVETLRELSEHWDGSGKPRGLKGEAILVEARVVAVANAFVALASPRAYRAGIGLDAAVDKLREQAGAVFDRRAVTALENSLENRGGRVAWADFGRAG
jgi:HD-GYP domain-containing protein (c-di-GMP phosphodiesterase class II)